IEDFLLDIHPMNTNRSAAKLGAVEHDVVRLALEREQGGSVAAVELGEVAIERAGERVVRSHPFLVFFAEIEQRKIGDPHPSVLGARLELQILGQLQPKLTEDLVDDL